MSVREHGPECLAGLATATSDRTVAGWASLLAGHGMPGLVANAEPECRAVSSHGWDALVTLSSPRRGQAYPVSLLTHYADYALEELREVDGAALRSVLGVAGRGLAAWLASSGFDRVAALDNLPLSTVLHRCPTREQLSAAVGYLTTAYPDRAIAVRSLNEEWDAEYLAHCDTLGALRLPSRMVYLREPGGKLGRDVKSDRKRLVSAGIRRVPLGPGDAGAIREQYRGLYLGKYSGYNPDFTVPLLAGLMERGLLECQGLLLPDGTLGAVFGFYEREGTMTTPAVGYVPGANAEHGLYLALSSALVEIAEERGLRLNSSSGASACKRNRGSHACVEHTAVFCSHLPASRQAPYRVVSSVASRLLVPLMRRQGL